MLSVGLTGIMSILDGSPRPAMVGYPSSFLTSGVGANLLIAGMLPAGYAWGVWIDVVYACGLEVAAALACSYCYL